MPDTTTRTDASSHYGFTADDIANKIGIPFDEWAHQCHAISIAILKAGFFPSGRVARGSCGGVGSQHSWIVDGPDVYDDDAVIIDPTLWSYRDDVDGIVVCTPEMFGHLPHGSNSIWRWGSPESHGGDPIVLDRTGLSDTACVFLDLIEPLDCVGWGQLVSSGAMQGWPSREIITRVCETPELAPYVPIDIEGMLTDRNPNCLYLP